MVGEIWHPVLEVASWLYYPPCLCRAELCILLAILDQSFFKGMQQAVTITSHEPGALLLKGVELKQV